MEFEDSISMQLDLIWKKDAANPAVPLFVSYVRQLVEQGAALA